MLHASNGAYFNFVWMELLLPASGMRTRMCAQLLQVALPCSGPGAISRAAMPNASDILTMMPLAASQVK